jgi:hypothetical protein
MRVAVEGTRLQTYHVGDATVSSRCRLANHGACDIGDMCDCSMELRGPCAMVLEELLAKRGSRGRKVEGFGGSCRSRRQ